MNRAALSHNSHSTDFVFVESLKDVAAIGSTRRAIGKVAKAALPMGAGGKHGRAAADGQRVRRETRFVLNSCSSSLFSRLDGREFAHAGKRQILVRKKLASALGLLHNPGVSILPYGADVLCK
jgi:hypothetical protein